MSKLILLSIKPKWVAKILNGEKTIEIRKNKALYKATKKLIEEQGYATFLMYCSKNGYGLIKLKEAGIKPFYPKEYDIEDGYKLPNLNGKVVAKFTVRKVEQLKRAYDETIDGDRYISWKTKTIDVKDIYRKTCCAYWELVEYLGDKQGYAYHIEDLVIFDKPRELSSFYKAGAWKIYEEQFDSSYLDRTEQDIMESLNQTLTKAPRNFVFVESEE